MRKDIIIIDDDRDLCTLLQESLLQENICADISCNGFDGTKPFEMEEFFARVLSLIRRYTRLNNMASKAILKYGDLRIDLESGIVELSGEELKLSAKEYDVLIYLAKNQGKILTKKQIYENVWNEEYVYDDDNIMAVISRLRKKIERTAENSYIQTVRGLGYRFNKEL